MSHLLEESSVDQELQSWVELRRTRDRRGGQQLSLMLEAVHIEHGIFQQHAETILVVRPQDVQRASEECERYEKENLNWPPRGEALGNLSEGLIGAFGWAAIFTVVEVLVRARALDFDWFGRGRGLAGAERSGEIWRAVTGLSLHVDLSHFLSNLLFGALFTMLACELVGGGLGLSLILISGALGNLANALLQDPAHASVGASTAVFAALGLLVTYQWRRRHQLKQSAFRRWAPLFAGGFLLASMGLTPETAQFAARSVDFGAHATGFAVGALGGIALSLFRVKQLGNPTLQTAALAFAPAMFVLAWWSAF